MEEVKQRSGPTLYQKAGRLSVIIAGNVLAVGLAAYYEVFNLLAVLAVILVFLIFGSLIVAYRILIRPAENLTAAIERLNTGTTEDLAAFKPEGELAEAGRHLVELVGRINSATEFIAAMAKRELNSLENEKFSHTLQSNSPLGLAIRAVENRLRLFAEEERQRSWSSAGLSRFMEILRSENEDADKLYDSIVSETVKYIGARQGALFLAEEFENQEMLVLKSWYAYDRKKYLDKHIAPGEGLVGQVYLEKAPIYLTDLPEDYPEISSGLGQAQPVCVFIIPLIANNSISGILEINSFREIAEYRREFVLRLSESIASSIMGIRNVGRVKKLLFESQQQSEQMRAQEEEMRQNLEELTATQEEMRRKQAELEQANLKMVQNEERLRFAAEQTAEQHRLAEESSQAMKEQAEKTQALNERFKSGEEVLKKALISLRKQKEEARVKIDAVNALLAEEKEKNARLEALLKSASDKNTP